MAATLQIRTAKDDKPYLVLIAANGQVLMTSETYDSPSNARRAWSDVMDALDSLLTFQRGERPE